MQWERAIFDDHRSQPTAPISMKLETYNYHSRSTVAVGDRFRRHESYDVFPHKDVLFGRSLNIAFHLGRYTNIDLQKLGFAVINRRFKPSV